MLSKRLSICASLVTQDGVVCDVGTDHAYLLAELLQSGTCKRAIATDIHRGPIMAARRTLLEAGVIGQAKLFLCDGLEAVPSEGITDVVIAGMGGETIVHILQNCKWCSEVHLILQPMTKHSTLRRWLAEQGFEWKEHIASEVHKFYSIFDVRYAGTKGRTLTEIEAEIGYLDWTDPEVMTFISWKRRRYGKLAQQLRLVERKTEAAYWQTLADYIEERQKGQEDSIC